MKVRNHTAASRRIYVVAAVGLLAALLGRDSLPEPAGPTVFVVCSALSFALFYVGIKKMQTGEVAIGYLPVWIKIVKPAAAITAGAGYAIAYLEPISAKFSYAEVIGLICFAVGFAVLIATPGPVEAARSRQKA